MLYHYEEDEHEASEEHGHPEDDSERDEEYLVHQFSSILSMSLVGGIFLDLQIAARKFASLSLSALWMFVIFSPKPTVEVRSITRSSPSLSTSTVTFLIGGSPGS